MNSKILVGHVTHARMTPKKHSFAYPVFLFAIDLDELCFIDETFSLFGYNRTKLFSIFDADYFLPLGDQVKTIKQKLMHFLHHSGCNETIERVMLVTAPRYFGYVFNPVSFYHCYNSQNELRYAVAEVNNTFGERHLYILMDHLEVQKGFAAHFRLPKDFHVSPFYDIKGDYDFHFGALGDEFDIRINVLENGKQIFFSQLSGKALEFSRQNIVRTVLRWPFSAALTFSRILWQAGVLHFIKRLPVFTKPVPRSAMTIQVAKPTWMQSIARHIVKNYFGKFRKGHLRVLLPNGQEEWNFGDVDSEFKAVMLIRENTFFSRGLKGADIAFGEMFTDRTWDSPDVTKVLYLFAMNYDCFDDGNVVWAGLERVINNVSHALRKNSIHGSKSNIRAHYDLSNELFATFLDQSMQYSSALFENSSDTLEDAQKRKIEKIIARGAIQSSDHVLEIGTGWGGLAESVAKTTGCRLTSLTISQEQWKAAKEKVARAGLSDRVSIEFCDYRRAQGLYDKMVSVEMIEAVGEEFLETYFQSCQRLLKPGGTFVLQAITMAEDRYPLYKKRCDWIQKYIFPGSHIPSVSRLLRAIGQAQGLYVVEMERMGDHYVKTLGHWRDRLLKASEQLKAKGYDDNFIRTFQYYFSYCEAGFLANTIDVYQIVLRRLSKNIDCSKDENADNTTSLWERKDRQNAFSKSQP